MGDLVYLQDFLAEPEAGAAANSGGFLSKPSDNSPVTIDPGNAVPEEPAKAQDVNKSVGQHTKESLLPKVRKVADTKERATKILGAAVPDVSEVPVPSGGIGLLLFISILMVFAITAVKGTGVSRLQLIWGSMLGNYSLGGSDSSGSSPTSQSSGTPSFDGGISSFIQGGGA